ncbi:MAG: DUF4118 domain-containing protein, partial [Pirellulales bacterium]|nr:DUF4118 domain-containing protein [Pirellulales bacterium]
MAAIAIVVAAVALRTWIEPLMGSQSVVVFLGAIILGAWLGGVGPALLCSLTLHVAHGRWFRDPPLLWDPDFNEVVSTLAYYVVGVTVGALSELRTAAQRRARDEHEQAVAQREQLHITLSCMADGVLVVDSQGRITQLNPAAADMVGCDLAEASGRPWAEVFQIRRDATASEQDRPLDHVLRQRCVVQASAWLMPAAGALTPIAYSAAP